MSLLERIDLNLRQHRLLSRNARVVVAVSGGVDSMVLLHALAGLAREPGHGWKLVAAHYNHRLRGRSSDADQRLVLRTAQRLGLPCEVDSGDVKGLAAEQGTSLEMAGRHLRHEFLARIARKHRAKCIALAHHADDQVELFFLRLLRGAGSEGLAGMHWASASPVRRETRLIRPLLDQPKSALLDYARAHQVAFREDVTNVSHDFLRNRIRRELIPLLERNYQPALSRVLLRQMEILRAESEFLNDEAAGWMQNKGGRSWDRLPIALQRRCLQAQLHQKGVIPSFDLIEALRAQPGKPVMIEPGRTARCDQEGMVEFSVTEAPSFKEDVCGLTLMGRSGRTAFGSLDFRWRIQARPGLAIPERALHREWFDADKVGRNVILRHWRPGDRFQPIGMRRPVKLQNLFTNLKIPRARRQELIVATTKEGVVWWVEGLRMGESFKVDSNTTRRLEWSWKKLPP